MAKYDTLVELWKRAIETHPDRPLFGTKVGAGADAEWRWTTYLEFGRAVDKLRASFHELGIGKADKVAIIANNRVEWAVACYAAYGIGAAFVPMYEAQSSKEWNYILRDASAKCVVVATDAIAHKLAAFELPELRHVVSLDPSTAADVAADRQIHKYAELLRTESTFEAVNPSPHDIASLIYTSGTTGQPKGVMLSHRNIAANVNSCMEFLPMTPSDRSLSFLPWAHVFGQTAELHMFLATGASMALAESVEKILPNLQEVRPTVLVSVPRIFNRIYTTVQAQIAAKPAFIQAAVKSALATRHKMREGESPGLAAKLVLALTDRVVFSKVRARFGGRLRYAVSGGAALSPDVAEFVDSLGISVFEGYGLTETSPVLAVNRPGYHRIGTVGQPIPGVRIVIDPEGEIIAYGDNIMKGYYKKPEETALVMTADGGFRTGDMGKLEDGFLRITGRIKEQYKLENGKYVVPTPLEEQVKLSPYVANVMVYGDNRPYNIAIVVPAFPALETWAAQNGVEGKGAALFSSDKVRELYAKEVGNLGEKFKGFESIRDFLLVPEDFTTDNDMLTPSLKLKRRGVMDAYGAAIDKLYADNKDKPRARDNRADA